MDDVVGRLWGDVQAVQVVHVAAKDLRSGTGEHIGAPVRTVERDHVMACVDEFGSEKGTDKAGIGTFRSART